MPASLYEQFLAVGSVKSLLTGKEISPPRPEKEAVADDQPSLQEQSMKQHPAS